MKKAVHGWTLLKMVQKSTTAEDAESAEQARRAAVHKWSIWHGFAALYYLATVNGCRFACTEGAAEKQSDFPGWC